MSAPGDMARIERKLDRLLSLVDSRTAQPAPLGMTVAQAMVFTVAKSRSAFYRWAIRHKVRPYAPGKYRVRDLENGVARAAAAAMKTEGVR